MERDIVEKAIKSLEGGDFNCMPMVQFREPSYQFETATRNMVAKAGCKLEWKNTFRGGCWHLVPNA